MAMRPLRSSKVLSRPGAGASRWSVRQGVRQALRLGRVLAGVSPAPDREDSSTSAWGPRGLLPRQQRPQFTTRADWLAYYGAITMGRPVELRDPAGQTEGPISPRQGSPSPRATRRAEGGGAHRRARLDGHRPFFAAGTASHMIAVIRRQIAQKEAREVEARAWAEWRKKQ